MLFQKNPFLRIQLFHIDSLYGLPLLSCSLLCRHHIHSYDCRCLLSLSLLFGCCFCCLVCLRSQWGLCFCRSIIVVGAAALRRLFSPCFQGSRSYRSPAPQLFHSHWARWYSIAGYFAVSWEALAAHLERRQSWDWMRCLSDHGAGWLLKCWCSLAQLFPVCHLFIFFMSSGWCLSSSFARWLCCGFIALSLLLRQGNSSTATEAASSSFLLSLYLHPVAHLQSSQHQGLNLLRLSRSVSLGDWGCCQPPCYYSLLFPIWPAAFDLWILGPSPLESAQLEFHPNLLDTATRSSSLLQGPRDSDSNYAFMRVDFQFSQLGSASSLLELLV